MNWSVFGLTFAAIAALIFVVVGWALLCAYVQEQFGIGWAWLVFGVIGAAVIATAAGLLA